MRDYWDLAIIGGGAAGFFAAAELVHLWRGKRALRIGIFEQGLDFLQKVRISGGGRCNLTHACFEPRELVKYYPRGGRVLLGPFHRFGPEQTLAWFGQRGLWTHTEADGRIFPLSNRSESVIDCLTGLCREGGVVLQNRQKIEGISPKEGGGYLLNRRGQMPIEAAKVLIATGSQPSVWDWLARDLGLSIVPPLPSLFTFVVPDSALRELSGLSLEHSHLRLPAFKKLEAQGPLLITHRGLSGPAVLRLSAWGAEALAQVQYQTSLLVDWLGLGNEALGDLQDFRASHSRKQLGSLSPWPKLPQRLWHYLLNKAELDPSLQWANLSNKQMQNLAQMLQACPLEVRGKNTFKDEFVTAGGIDCKQIDFTRFESKAHRGLFFAGEVLNIDALTGGFNFQAAWTGAYHVAQALAQDLAS